MEIIDATLPQRIERNNPRVVKKPVSKFQSKKVKHRGTVIKINPRVFNPTFRKFLNRIDGYKFKKFKPEVIAP